MINFIQLDPNGLCNAGCWFCPVSTLGNPKNQINQMDINLLDKIISEIVNLKGDLINPNLHFIYGSHFNEVLLYRHFESMLEILNKNKLTIGILTNGVPLTPQKIDLINKHQPAVSMIAINAPVYEKRLFEKRTGMKEVMFDKLIRNIDYALNNLYNPDLLLLHINGINEHSNIIKLKNFPDLEKNEMQNQVNIAKKLFPSIKIYEQWNLIDRAGLLKDVMLNNIPEGEVIGCSVKRDSEWLHISPKGDVFLCCNDYYMEYSYGNLKDKTIKEIWFSKERDLVNKRAFNSICKECSSAIIK
jgi:radical SAM protein with 4Fe4S-binding SPASM domain|tara:strand:- start:1928 stop:2830 length:903 start_codon:yes stop_codon:yes gene_type:complete